MCVCLSRFSLFSPHLIERSRLFVSWCSSPCSLLVAPQEACRSHYSQKKVLLCYPPSVFSINTSNLKTKRVPEREENIKFWDSFLLVRWFCQESFQLIVVKMDFHWLVSGWKEIEPCVHNPEPRTVQVQKHWNSVRSEFSSELDSRWNISSWKMETNCGYLVIKCFFTKWGVFLLNSTLFNWHL